MDPVVGESMELIAEEAERQGFQVSQTERAAWRFRKAGNTLVVAPRTVADVLDALSYLISAGLDWAPFKDA
jgi:hypothetical protein